MTDTNMQNSSDTSMPEDSSQNNQFVSPQSDAHTNPVNNAGTTEESQSEPTQQIDSSARPLPEYGAYADNNQQTESNVQTQQSSANQSSTEQPVQNASPFQQQTPPVQPPFGQTPYSQNPYGQTQNQAPFGQSTGAPNAGQSYGQSNDPYNQMNQQYAPQGAYQQPAGNYGMPQNPYINNSVQPQSWNVLSILGFVFVLTFFLAPIGLILSIIGAVQAGKRNEKGKGFAIAGIVIGSIASFLLVSVVGLFMYGLDAIKNDPEMLCSMNSVHCERDDSTGEWKLCTEDGDCIDDLGDLQDPAESGLEETGVEITTYRIL